MRQNAPTHEERLRAAFTDLTPAERQLASHILKNYPVAALGSITALAKAAGVSTPTVVRLTQKLGFKGYPDFQTGLRDEVEERLISPLVKHDRWAGNAPQTHLLNAFADAVVGNLQATLSQVGHAEFDALAQRLAEEHRHVYSMGGRITHAMADYFVTHMKVIREGLTLISDNSNTWPPALLDIREGDILVVFDIRRYENNVLQVAEVAREQGAEVVLFTDQWVSPAAEFARVRLTCHVEAPSAWDSSATILVLVETLIAAIQTHGWKGTQARMKRLEQLYDRTRFFRGRRHPFSPDTREDEP